MTKQDCLPGVPIEHKPLRPPRAETLGEQVFASRWAELMERESYDLHDYSTPLEQVLYRLRCPIDQRAATVAASLITWLGTNCGRGLLHDCARMEAGPLGGYGRGYLAAWHLENTREPGTNYGVRTAEFLLAPPDARITNGGNGDLPKLSADDYEVLEQTVRWLSTEDGKSFVTACISEIERLDLTKRVTEAVAAGNLTHARQLLQNV